jgi:hypothetical protein
MQNRVRPFRVLLQDLDSFGSRQYLELDFTTMSLAVHLCFGPAGLAVPTLRMAADHGEFAFRSPHQPNGETAEDISLS